MEHTIEATAVRGRPARPGWLWATGLVAAASVLIALLMLAYQAAAAAHLVPRKLPVKVRGGRCQPAHPLSAVASRPGPADDGIVFKLRVDSASGTRIVSLVSQKASGPQARVDTPLGIRSQSLRLEPALVACPQR